MPSGNEYTVQSAGFRKVNVVISPDDYRGLSPENLRRAEQMIRETEVAQWERHNFSSKDWGNVIGVTQCVVIRPGDDVVYARLKGRDVYGKFVLNRQPEPSSYLTINVKCVRGVWRLIRAFVGEHAPAFLGDHNVARGSWKFWETHALLWGVIPVDKCDNEPVTDCPWKKERWRP